MFSGLEINMKYQKIFLTHTLNLKVNYLRIGGRGNRKIITKVYLMSCR